MSWTSFMANHTFGIAIFIILLALIWKFGIQPRLAMTSGEIADKVEKFADDMTVDTKDLIDQESMPEFGK